MRLLSGRWPVFALAISPLIVLSPFLFRGYAISQSDLAVDTSQRYLGLGLFSIADPAHSSNLNEPYMYFLKEEFSRGRFPLLNMQNGMGAAGVESLLTGSLYILNPLVLPLLPANKPLAYDLYQILHICILLSGFYALSRRYASPFAAAIVAILVAFSGVTYLWINLDIYRSFSWLPWATFAAIGIVRGIHVRRNIWLLALAVVACISAGNLQEAVCDLFALSVVVCCEYASRANRSRTSGQIFLIAFAAALLIAAVSVLPYLLSMHDGNLFANNQPDRSMREYDRAWILSWMLPKAGGFFPYQFIRNGPYWPFADFSALGCFLAAAGFFHACFSWRRGERGPSVVLGGVLPVVIVLGIANILNFPPFPLIRHIPVLNGFFFIKYHLYLFALVSIPMAIGLETLMEAARERSREVTQAAGIGIFVLLVGADIYLSTRPNYSLTHNVPEPVRMIVYRYWFVSVAVFGAGAGLAYFRSRFTKPVIMALVIAQGLLFLPPGFSKRKPEYQTLESSAQFGHQRILAAASPNDNIFEHLESLTLYDGISNEHYHEFMIAQFPLLNGFSVYQIYPPELGVKQLKALELTGVTAIHGFKIQDEAAAAPYVRRASSPDSYEVLNPLPRLFVIRRETYEKFKDPRLAREPVDAPLSAIQADLATIPQPTDVRVDETNIDFQLPNRTGVLVLNQSYSTYWKLGDEPGKMLLGLWPAWPLGPQNGTDRIHYWPAGLTWGIGSAVLGVAALALLDRVIAVRSTS